MALIRYAPLDGGGQDDAAGYKAYVDQATGEAYKQVITGGDDGAQTTYVPLGKTWEYTNKAGVDGRNVYGAGGYTPTKYSDDGEGGTTAGAPGGFTARGDYQLGNWQPDATLSNFLKSRGITPRYDEQSGWVIPAEKNPGAVMTDYATKINPRNGMSSFGEFYSSVIGPAMQFYAVASGLGGLAAMGAGGTAMAAETAASIVDQAGVQAGVNSGLLPSTALVDAGYGAAGQAIGEAPGLLDPSTGAPVDATTGLNAGELVPEGALPEPPTGIPTPEPITTGMSGPAIPQPTTLEQFVSQTFSPQNILKTATKEAVKAGIKELASSGATGGSSTPSIAQTAAGATGSAAGAGTSAGGGYLDGIGFAPTDAPLERLSGGNVFTDYGSLSIPGRGIINGALPA